MFNLLFTILLTIILSWVPVLVMDRSLRALFPNNERDRALPSPSWSEVYTRILIVIAAYFLLFWIWR